MKKIFKKVKNPLVVAYSMVALFIIVIIASLGVVQNDQIEAGCGGNYEQGESDGDPLAETDVYGNEVLQEGNDQIFEETDQSEESSPVDGIKFNTAGVEKCDNQIDDDGDGNADCKDIDCLGFAKKFKNTNEWICSKVGERATCNSKKTNSFGTVRRIGSFEVLCFYEYANPSKGSWLESDTNGIQAKKAGSTDTLLVAEINGCEYLSANVEISGIGKTEVWVGCECGKGPDGIKASNGDQYNGYVCMDSKWISLTTPQLLPLPEFTMGIKCSHPNKAITDLFQKKDCSYEGLCKHDAVGPQEYDKPAPPSWASCSKGFCPYFSGWGIHEYYSNTKAKNCTRYCMMLSCSASAVPIVCDTCFE